MAMKWIGLTGGIGTGKSTVAELLRKRGIQVVDADQLAREAVAKNSTGLRAVLKEFGPSIQTKDGELDRQAMAQLVFKSKENLAKLEQIVHPIVRRLADEKRRELEERGDKFAFYDVPLLFEKQMEPMFDYIVVVTAKEENQLQRLKKRNGWSESQIRDRIASQIPLKTKSEEAHFVIVNDGSIDHLEKQIDTLLKTI